MVTEGIASAWHMALGNRATVNTIIARAGDLGLDGEEFIAKIADEKTAESEEQVVEFITNAGHPAVEMDPMF